jgi:hypothetical protein
MRHTEHVIPSAQRAVRQMTTSFLDDNAHIPARGQLDVTDAPGVSDMPGITTAAVNDALERLYDFFVENYPAIVAMPSAFATARQGLPLVAEPHELANTVLSKLADRITDSTSRSELDERLEKYSRLGYIYRCMENENNDQARRQRRIRPLPDQPEQLDGFQTLDRPLGRDDEEDRHNLTTVLNVLRIRADRSDVHPTCLTPLHIRCWQAVVDGHGAQAALAKELHVDPSRITQIKASASAKVHESLYVAGVLASPGTLGDAERINACLDIYDATRGPDRTLSTEQRARLATAAPTVRIDPTDGQRADHRAAASRYLRRKDKRALRAEVATSTDRRERFDTEFAASLHTAEVTQAVAVKNPHPNCALNCSAHNPVHDRVIFEIEWT